MGARASAATAAAAHATAAPDSCSAAATDVGPAAATTAADAHATATPTTAAARPPRTAAMPPLLLPPHLQRRRPGRTLLPTCVSLLPASAGVCEPGDGCSKDLLSVRDALKPPFTSQAKHHMVTCKTTPTSASVHHRKKQDLNFFF